MNLERNSKNVLYPFPKFFLRYPLRIKTSETIGNVRRLSRVLDVALLVIIVALVVFVPGRSYAFNPASGISPNANVNTGWYDNRQIYYAKATLQINPQEAANLIAARSVVYHVQNPDGSIPTFQTTLPVPPTGGVATAGNVISQIPGEVGYSGGNWNLQFFTWNKPATRALTSDTDILAAVANGEGTLTVTDIVVRCPVIDFSNLR